MSTYVPIKSVCGAVTTTIDIYDIELNDLLSKWILFICKRVEKRDVAFGRVATL